MKHFKRRQIFLIVSTVLLLFIGVFHSIYIDGIGLISIVFPYSLLVLIFAVIAFVWGYKNRKTHRGWYVYSLIILVLAFLVLWTPVLKNSRKLVERNWRWEPREQVVEAIKSGKLKPFMEIDTGLQNNSEYYYVAAPFSSYGRVSFQEIYGKDNVLEVKVTPETGMTVDFTTDGGFFGPKSMLIYIEKSGGFDQDESYVRISDHWYIYEKETSWISF